MKPIKLEESHKEKLLEMCKTLYPECDIYLDCEDGESTGFLVIKDQYDYIYWFEFVIEHLAPKLGYYPYRLFRALSEEEMDKHIIDFLYEQYQNKLR